MSPIIAAGGGAGVGGPERRRRSTIRWRLTAIYGFAFIACGAMLLFVSYLLVRESLRSEEGTTPERVIESYGYSTEQVDWFYALPVPPPAEGTGRDAATVGDVIVGVQRDIRNDALDTLLLGSGAALLAMVAVAIGVGWLAAGRVLQPVGRLTQQARGLSEENLHERIALEGPPDELKELADTLDSMLGRLEVAFTTQRSFAANVSHELRTPLAIMRGEADLALAAPDATERERSLARVIQDSAARTEALLDALMALSRSESTMNARDPVDLAELAGDVVGERIAAADQAGVRLELELGAADVVGDRWLLERLLANLVDNGITHNERGGWLRVRVEGVGREARVSTINSGPVLSVTQVEDVLRPFHRLEGDRRPGYGLGMTIVQSVVTAHGGTIELTARPEGGLAVEVRLPGVGTLARAPETGPIPDPEPEPTPQPV